MRPSRRGATDVQLRQLPPLADQDLAALRASVEQTISRSKKLREMAARTGYTPEDVASEALVRYLGASDREIENPAAWMVTAARNFVYDLHKKGLQRETAAEPGSHTLDQARRGEELPVDESLDRRFESRLYDAAIRRLDERDRRAVAAFEQEGSMRAVERRYGIPKSNVQRAFKRLQREIASESGPRAPRRARSRALAYHLGFLSPSQTEELQSRLSWDTGLLMELRALQLGARRTAALFPLPAGIEASDASSLGERIAALADRVRDGAQSVVSRGAGHETEAAAAAAASGAGTAAKAIVAVCIGGSVAAGVCVERGVVDLSGADASEAVERPATQDVAEQPVPETPPLGTNDAAGSEPVTDPPEPSAPTAKEQVARATGFERSESSSSQPASSGEFGAPANGGGGSGASGGGGGSGGFGIE